MNEDINILEKNIEYFFEKKNINYKNDEFKSYFYQGDENTNNLHVIYDNKNYIYYLLNIPKNKENIIKEKNEYEIIITDSTYDLFFYRKSRNQNNISCLLILIINDIDIKLINENYLEFKEEKLVNINFQENIINKIKITIIDYIKNKALNGNTYIQNILLGEKEYNFLYNKYLNENINDNIKAQIEYLTTLFSKVEIKALNNNNFEIDNLFMNVYEILSPSYKSNLAQKYLNEMPMNLNILMEKYQYVYINKNSYNNYKNIKLLSKNKNTNINKNINNNIKIINFKINKENINRKKIRDIFKLKKLKRIKGKKALKIINGKINVKIKNKKSLFKIHKIKLKKEENNINKTNIEDGKQINKKKKLFKCITSKSIPKMKSNNIFIIKK